MWPHLPLGRSLMTLALASMAAAALILDAAAPSPATPMMAWHALSTAALAGAGIWALWGDAVPREAGQRAARGVAVLMVAAMAAAVSMVPAGRVGMLAPVLTAAAFTALSLFAVGTHWARREIRW